MSGVNEIRSSFLQYFEKHGHEIVSSGPLVPHNDPTLMFTNAGMVPFKNLFTGQETRSYNRAATSQKCVRAGGKHNDLDNVGYTARHHTFFEMLGNFSFGDYFKAQAIELAWNLLTRDFAIDPRQLLVTVFHEDDEAYDLWRNITGLPDDKIIRIATHDNFWMMGDTGPCGPCSEIFFDHGEHIPGGPPGSPDEDGDRFIEIWNLVFMQFEQLDAENRQPLPKPSIDTGMGLERIAAVLQGRHDNYDIDLFQTLIANSVELTGVEAIDSARVSHRVIADHLRSASFLIADGVLPSNEGRGYVLRRIMRRGMRHAQLLGAEDPLMWRLVPKLVGEMGQAFPELGRAQSLIEETLRSEETRFRRTLRRGLAILDEASSDLEAGDKLDGEVAFKLYDTYGFPLDLTEDALRSRSIDVDTAAFESAMAAQKARARASWAGSGETGTDAVWIDARERLGASEFLGYDNNHAQGIVLGLFIDGEEVNRADAGQTVALIANQTPFYGESGGQQGDHGRIFHDSGTLIVTDTQKYAGDLVVHHARVDTGSVQTGDAVSLQIDVGRREGLRANHSATHLIHEALRQVLGDHVAQKGSLVAPDRLRFDFSHSGAIEPDQLRQVSEIANSVVRQNSPVTTQLMAVDDAINSGATALFGEKYGDEVRVVSMGIRKVDEDEKTYSVELCGGTHVGSTGEIGLIKVLGDSAVSAGVRRLEALSGQDALDYLNQRDAQLKQISATLKSTPDEAVERISALIAERQRLESELSSAKQKLALGGGSGGQDASSAETLPGGLCFSARVLDEIAAKELKSLADQAKSDLGSGVVVLIARGEDGKASIVVGVTQDLVDRISAVDLVRLGSAALGGKGGGGRPDMAQAGGPNGAEAEAAVAAIRTHLEAG